MILPTEERGMTRQQMSLATIRKRHLLKGKGETLFLLASRISDAGVRLPYADLVRPTPPTPGGPWNDWLRILASSSSSSSSSSSQNMHDSSGIVAAAIEGVVAAAALERPLGGEATPCLSGMAEELLTHATRHLSDSEWADWLKVPLIGAASQGDIETVSTLLRAGAGGGSGRGIGAWMIPGGDGRTLLHSAADGGEASVVETLLEAGSGVVVNAIAGGGFSPFHVAVIRGSVPAAMALARAGAAVHRKAPFRQSPLHLAAGTGHAEMIRSLAVDLRVPVEGVDDVGATALHTAAWHGSEECVRVLLLPPIGAKVNARDDCGRSALFQASRCEGRTAGCRVMRELLHAGAEVRTSSEDGETPLHVACRYGRLEAVHLLLRHDADERARCDLRKTPGDVAREAERRGDIPADVAEAIYAALAASPAGRAWRRRGWLVMLRARSVVFLRESGIREDCAMDAAAAAEAVAEAAAVEVAAAEAAAAAEPAATEAAAAECVWLTDANGWAPPQMVTEDAVSEGKFFSALQRALGHDKRAGVAAVWENGSEQELLLALGGEPGFPRVSRGQDQGQGYAPQAPQQQAALATAAVMLPSWERGLQHGGEDDHWLQQEQPRQEEEEEEKHEEEDDARVFCDNDAVREGGFDLAATYDDLAADEGRRVEEKEEMRVEHYAGRFGKLRRRSSAFLVRRARSSKGGSSWARIFGGDAGHGDDPFLGLVIRVLELSDGPFEIIGRYM